MTFRVGQKVVCVDGHTNPPASGGVVDGVIYTIREVGLTVDGEAGVRVHELKLSSGPHELGLITRKPFFDAFMRQTRFRPVVERKTSIDVFTKMLKPQGADA